MVQFHLPGLFEFYEFYKVFLPLFYNERELFYEWADIGSIYGAPEDCIWSGGRFEFSEANVNDVLALFSEYNISARLTFSNSCIKEEHLADKRCNELCKLLEENTGNKNGIRDDNRNGVQNGIIVHSDLLLNYIRKNYPGLYLVSSTTKVLTDFDLLVKELRKEEFMYVVPDFRLNKQFEKLDSLTSTEKNKLEFLCNECCYVGCTERKECYENVSRRIMGYDCPEHECKAPGGSEGYLFSKAMKNPMFISTKDITDVYQPMGFTNFKIEGRNLGSALILEFLLYYLAKPEHWLEIREKIYLDSMLNLF